MQVNQDMKTYNDKRLSVLIIADLMAKREQSRWNDLTYAATPAASYLARLLSTIYAVGKGSNWCICSQDIYSSAAMPGWRTFENQVRKLNRIKKKEVRYTMYERKLEILDIIHIHNIWCVYILPTWWKVNGNGKIYVWRSLMNLEILVDSIT